MQTDCDGAQHLLFRSALFQSYAELLRNRSRLLAYKRWRPYLWRLIMPQRLRFYCRIRLVPESCYAQTCTNKFMDQRTKTLRKHSVTVSVNKWRLLYRFIFSNIKKQSNHEDRILSRSLGPFPSGGTRDAWASGTNQSKGDIEFKSRLFILFLAIN